MSASTLNRFRLTLEKLAAEPPTTKTALVRLLLPAIEAAFASGKTWKDVWQCLADDGLNMSYETFRKVLSRARKKARASAAAGGESPQLPSGGFLGEANTAPLDPLANLKRLEQNRPGFHWRATGNVKDSDMSWAEWREKNKRQ